MFCRLVIVFLRPSGFRLSVTIFIATNSKVNHFSLALPSVAAD